MSNPSYSPVRSTSTDVSRRRLSSFSRRGSTSAPDPWDQHPYEIPTGSTSRLHIVRLPPPTEQEIAKVEREHGHIRRRSSGGANTKMEALRMSFAQPLSPTVSSGGMNSGPPSPGGAGKRVHPSTLSSPLAPQQLYDLAMQSIHPQTSEDVLNAQPVLFTPLPSSHYLPFIVRSTEVSQLLSQGPPRRLWALIKQIYPQNLTEESNDPTRWPFYQLERWIFSVCRHEANDRLWVTMARRCITRRSEPLWEKLKNALGVPPELEMDDNDKYGEGIDLIAMGKKGSAGPDGVDAALAKEEAEAKEALSEPVSAMGMTGLLMEPIYPEDAKSPSLPSVGTPSGEEAFGFGGAETGMEVIGEEEEEEKIPAADKSELQSDATPDLEQEEVLEPARMVGLTIVSHSQRVDLDKLREEDAVLIDSPASDGPNRERRSSNAIFPTSFANLSISPNLPSRRSPLSAFVLEQGSSRLGGLRFQRPQGSEYAVSTASEGSDR